MKEEDIADKIYELLDEAVADEPAEAVLFSGGVDSSTVLKHNLDHNPDVRPITVATRDSEASDVEYARRVADELGAQEPAVKRISEPEMEEALDDVIESLETFSREWISSGLTLYFGVQEAKERGFETVASGEGSDDLFGSFPGFIEWEGGDRELKDLLERRIEDIDLMTRAAADSYGITYITPYHDEEVTEFALEIPMEFRTREVDGETVSKYILREAYRDELPDIALNRPQTMAFEGSGTFDFVSSLGERIPDERIEELEDRHDIEFKSPEEAYLFERYNELVGHEKGEDNPCSYCEEELLREDSVHCRTCGTVEYEGEKIPF